MSSKHFKFVVSVLPLLSLLGTSGAMAKAVTYVVDDPKKEDLVSFTSDAPIELIVGHTNQIKGTVNIDDSLDLTKKPLDAQFDVDLASIDTGIPLRNEHMRDNFLETKKYPKATFKATSIIARPTIQLNGKMGGRQTVLKDGYATQLEATGEFTLHGKTIEKQIQLSATFRKTCSSQQKFDKCDLIQIKATFPISLQEYGIQRPQIVFQKLANDVIVTISATAHVSSAKPTK